MAGIDVGTKVKYINGRGQYASVSRQKFTSAVHISGQRGLEYARAKAPYSALKANVRLKATGNSKVSLISSLPYSYRTEMGGKSYVINGSMSFWWEAKNRNFGRPYPNRVTHPATKAKPFLRPALRIVERDLIKYLKGNL
jgi:hypothetical protein